MNDLRKYIDLISELETLSERRGRSRNRNKNKNKPNKKPQPQNQPPKPPAPTPPLPPKTKGEAIKNLIKNNPKAAKALGIIAGLSVLPYVSDKVRQQSTTPDQDNQPDDSAENRRQPSPSQDEIAKLKAKIDAMIKELEPSTDPIIKKELERIKQKLSGVTTNRRTGEPTPNYSSTTGSDWDYYQRARNFLDRIPNQ